MITMEDLIEEISGELQDEFDEEMALIAADPDGRIRLSGAVLITHVNDQLGLNLPHDTVRTISGLIVETQGRMPALGDVVTIGAASLQVESVDGHAVREVILYPAVASADATLGEGQA